MRTPSFHAPNLHLPRMRRSPGRTRAVAREPHSHHPLFQSLRRVEGGIDAFAIALVVLFCLAMIYAIFSPGQTPAYFDRWPGG